MSLESSLCCGAARGPGARQAYGNWRIRRRAHRRFGRHRWLVFERPLLDVRGGPRGAAAGAHVRRRDAALLQESAQSIRAHHLRQEHRRRRRTVRALDAALRQAGAGTSIPSWSAASARRFISRTVWERPFCRLLHFERMFCHMPRRPQPKLLIVAPMSGHYATLLRGTVEAFLPNHDVYITDWVDARMVPLSEGRFDLDDYIDYVIEHAALPRRRHPCHRGVPAVGAGAGGDRADGGRRRSLCAALDHADGRPDRHPQQSHRASTSSPRSAASNGSAATSSPRCRSRIPA